MASPSIDTVAESRQIALTNGGYTLVDAADYEWLSRYTWYRSGKGYALQSSKRPGKNSGVAMQRVILQPEKGMFADHINGDRLDNRRCNLRVVTKLQNAQNRGNNWNSLSKYKGVAWKVENNKWQARIRINLKQYHIGLYDTEEEAAAAYNQAAILHHGQYARLNMLPDGYAMTQLDHCPLCKRSDTEPVSVSLEKCAVAARDAYDSIDRNLGFLDAKSTAKAVLDAAGVQYHED